MIVALAFAAFVSTEGPVVTPKDAPSNDAPAADVVDDSAVPKEQADAFKAFSGTWRCDGKAQTDLDTDVATRVTVTFKNDLGRWMSVRIEEQKSAKNPKAMTSSETWGYAEALGGFVRNGADNQGGFYAGTSSG